MRCFSLRLKITLLTDSSSANNSLRLFIRALVLLCSGILSSSLVIYTINHLCHLLFCGQSGVSRVTLQYCFPAFLAASFFQMLALSHTHGLGKSYQAVHICFRFLVKPRLFLTSVQPRVPMPFSSLHFVACV